MALAALPFVPVYFLTCGSAGNFNLNSLSCPRIDNSTLINN